MIIIFQMATEVTDRVSLRVMKRNSSAVAVTCECVLYPYHAPTAHVFHTSSNKVCWGGGSAGGPVTSEGLVAK